MYAYLSLIKNNFSYNDYYYNIETTGKKESKKLEEELKPKKYFDYNQYFAKTSTFHKFLGKIFMVLSGLNLRVP